MWLLSADRAEDIPPLAFNTYEDWDLMKLQIKAAIQIPRPSSSRASRPTESSTSPNKILKTQLTIQTEIDPNMTGTSFEYQTPLSKQNSLSPLNKSPSSKRLLSPSTSSVSPSINSDEIRQITRQITSSNTQANSRSATAIATSRTDMNNLTQSLPNFSASRASTASSTSVREKNKNAQPSISEKFN